MEERSNTDQTAQNGYLDGVSNLIDGVDPEKIILDILKNIEDEMPKAKRKRTTNWQIVSDYILRRTRKGGCTSSRMQCRLLGVDPDGYTFK